LDIRLKRNVFLKAVEAVVTIVASFTQLAIITHSYESFVVGEYQLTLAWLFFVSALSCFGGIVMIATREMAQGSKEVHVAIFSTAIVLQALVAIPLGGISLLFFNSSFPELAGPLTVGTTALLGATILQLSQSLLVSKERIGAVVIASVVAQFIATTAIFLAAANGSSVSTLVGAWATFNIAHGVILFLQSRAWKMISLASVNPQILRRISFEALPVLVMVVATHLYVRLDVIMLDHFAAKAVVATYSASYLFLDQLMILSNFMMGALFPNFARSTVEGGKDFRLLYRGILTLFVKYLFPIAALTSVFSKYLLGVTYGAEYAAAWPSLSVLMLAAVFAWINGPSGTIFISLKKQHIYMWATLLSLGVNVIGNWILIPWIGAIGAAVSTVLTEMAICIFCLHWIYKKTGYLPWMKVDAN
jgi:O-antigen/teichoic acid export membrane protein